MTEQRYTLAELVTVEDAAEQLNIPRRTAQYRAQIRNIGRVFGHTRVLTPADVHELAKEPAREPH